MKRHAFKISPDPDIDVRPLMAAVVIQAVEDLTNRDRLAQLDAALFLSGDDCPMYADAAGLPNLDGLKFLTGGLASVRRAVKAIQATKRGRRNDGPRKHSNAV